MHFKTNKNKITNHVKKLYTINDFLYWTYNKLKNSNIWYGHGTNNPWDETLYLILTTIGIPLNTPKKIYKSFLTNNDRYMLIKAVRKRIINRIPVAYLVNKAWFCNKEFYIDKRVIIPRSPIAEIINKKFFSLIHHIPMKILDMCTGSGCIAIACAYAFPNAKIDAVDISKDALQVAKKNIDLHLLNNRVKILQSNLFQKVNKKYDIIITNPPYVNIKDMKILPKEYLHEPEISLNAGNDSLNIIKIILSHAKDYLTHKGILICEIGKDNVKYLLKKYFNIKFKLLSFKYGGSGVFVLNKTQLKIASKHIP